MVLYHEQSLIPATPATPLGPSQQASFAGWVMLAGVPPLFLIVLYSTSRPGPLTTIAAQAEFRSVSWSKSTPLPPARLALPIPAPLRVTRPTYLQVGWLLGHIHVELPVPLSNCVLLR